MADNTLKYGIVDKKNADLFLLNAQVQQAQYLVAQQQAIVTALTAKSAQFAGYLAQADSDQAAVLATLNLAKDAMTSVAALATSFSTAAGQAGSAAQGATDVAAGMATLIGKLIFSVEIIGKVGQQVNKQKTINPLVPDSLVTYLANAATAANNAIALTLAALQSCYVAEATQLAASGTIALGSKQARDAKKRMGQGWDERSQAPLQTAPTISLGGDGDGVLALLGYAYQAAVKQYSQALWDNNSVTRQLQHAQGKLADATVKLNSSKAGLAAATAAAYAA
jgi:hypothetical protein